MWRNRQKSLGMGSLARQRRAKANSRAHLDLRPGCPSAHLHSQGLTPPCEFCTGEDPQCRETSSASQLASQPTAETGGPDNASRATVNVVNMVNLQKAPPSNFGSSENLTEEEEDRKLKADFLDSVTEMIPRI